MAENRSRQIYEVDEETVAELAALLRPSMPQTPENLALFRQEVATRLDEGWKKVSELLDKKRKGIE